MCHDSYDSFKPTTETFAFVYVHPVITLEPPSVSAAKNVRTK